MQDGMKREVVSWKLSAAFFWWFLVMLNVFATCCYRMHANIIKHMLEKLTKMVPKWSQNLSKIDPGGSLEATWEPPLKQGAPKTSCLMILAPFWDPRWESLGSCWASFFWRFSERAFWWPWPPFGLPKDLQNKTQKGSKSKPENHWFCHYLQHFSHI